MHEIRRIEVCNRLLQADIAKNEISLRRDLIESDSDDNDNE